MKLWDGIAFSTGLLFEMVLLLAIWNWSVERKIGKALMGASALIILPVAISILCPISIPPRAYLGFAGMYIFAGLIWRWWKEGVAPHRWGASEVVLAALAAAFFSVASFALDRS